MSQTRNALITGGSRGFGLSLASRLVSDGWRVTITGRDPHRLDAAVAALGETVTAVPGDMVDPAHRRALAAAFGGKGLHLLVNNASTLGPTPLRPISALDEESMLEAFRTNVVGPAALTSLLLPELQTTGGTVVNVSSDAAVEAYEGWGIYGLTKAALDHATAVAAVENPAIRFFAFDPGDMRTDMHQAAFPDEDISDRPHPDTVVPALLALLASDATSGRYRAADLQVVA